MLFRDLREHVEEVPLYEASVVVRAEIALDRAYALNEVEAQRYIRERFQEVLPQFTVNRLKVNHKERRGGGNIWETEVAMQGRVQIDKAVPRDEIRSMVRDLTTRAGFGNTDVQVRGAEKLGKTEKEGSPDDRDITAVTKKMFAKEKTSSRAKEGDVRNLRRGDKVMVQRAGFMEDAEVVHVYKEDFDVELRFESDNTVSVVPFVKIAAIKEQS